MSNLDPNNNELSINALIAFTQRYQNAWHQALGHEPKSTELYGIASPCIVEKNIDTNDLSVFWQPTTLSDKRTLNIVEQVVGLQINPEAHIFYGSQYAGDMQAKFNDLAINLVQVWNDDDFSRLEQNLIAHLTMQKKLKRRPSIFIASTDDDTQIITIDNQTGAIVLEKLIENESTVLAESLAEFLDLLEPAVQ